MQAIYKFWCYNNGSGSAPIVDSVEVEVKAFSEELAKKNVMMTIKRDVYQLMTVRLVE